MEHNIRMLMDALDQIAFIHTYGDAKEKEKLPYLIAVRNTIWDRITTLYYALRDNGPSLR